MNIQQQIDANIAAQPEPKRSEMEEIHQRIVQRAPECQLWFDEGKNDQGKVVANPTIGYGFQVLKYANGTTKDFFRIGMCATTTGISVYILGIADKTYLATTYKERLGKAKVTGYCISFKTLKDINIDVLLDAVTFGLEYPNEKKYK